MPMIESRGCFVKYFVQHKEGDHAGVTVCILITNTIPNEILIYTFSICGGYFNPPISLTRSIISITRIVSAIGNISLSVFPSPTSQTYPTGQLTNCSCRRISLPVHSFSWNIDDVPLWFAALSKRVNCIFCWAKYAGRDSQCGFCSYNFDPRTCRI
jgi:hypothetical protein